MRSHFGARCGWAFSLLVARRCLLAKSGLRADLTEESGTAPAPAKLGLRTDLTEGRGIAPAAAMVLLADAANLVTTSFPDASFESSDAAVVQLR